MNAMKDILQLRLERKLIIRYDQSVQQSKLMLQNQEYKPCVFFNELVGRHYPQARIKGAYLCDLEQIPFDPKIDVSIVTCFNCLQLGHPWYKCSRPKTHIFCNNCGRNNVTVDKCPRCAKAYTYHKLKEQTKKDREIKSIDGDLEKAGLKEIFEAEKNVECQKASKLCQILNQSINEIYMQDEDENYDDIIIDENQDSHLYTGNYLRSFLEFQNATLQLQDKDESYKDIIVDESEDSNQITGDFLDSFLRLTVALNVLPIEKQKSLAQIFVKERCTRIMQKKI